MMLIKNGGLNISTDEVVLFPFDDHSIPFQNGVRLQLVSHKNYSYKTKIVFGTEDSRTPGSRHYGPIEFSELMCF